MTIREFDAGGNALECLDCGRNGLSREHRVQGNQWRVVCPQCHSQKPRGHFWHLVHADKPQARRKDTPPGKDLDAVWASNGNRCVVCTLTIEHLELLGRGREAQHVAPYATNGHQGPLVPMCVPCHQNATARMHEAEHQVAMIKRFIQMSRAHAEPLSAGGVGVPAPWVSRDPVRPSGETPARPLEGLSDDDADA